MATTGLKNLQIYINPTGVGATAVTSEQINSYGKDAGYFLFDEVNQVLYVNGKAYGLKPEQAQAIADATTAINTLNGADSVSGSVAKSIKDALDELMGGTPTGISLGENVDPTIKNFLEALQSQINTGQSGISSINTEITNIKGSITAVEGRVTTVEGKVTALESATGTKIGGYTGTTSEAQHVQVSVTTEGGVVTGVTVTEDDIARASDLTSLSGVVAGISGAVAGIQGSAVTEIVGVETYTGTSIALDGTKLKVGNGTPEGATATAYSNSTISGAIDSLNAAINALSGGETGANLTDVLATIEKIKAEIMDTDSTEEGAELLNSLLDSLSSLQTKTTAYVGINASGTAPANNEAVALQTSLANLAALITNYKTANSLQNANEVSTAINTAIGNLAGSATGGYADATGAAQHVKVTVTTSGGQVSGVTVTEDDIARNSDLTSLSGVVANISNDVNNVVSWTVLPEQ